MNVGWWRGWMAGYVVQWLAAWVVERLDGNVADCKAGCAVAREVVQMGT